MLTLSHKTKTIVSYHRHMSWFRPPEYSYDDKINRFYLWVEKNIIQIDLRTSNHEIRKIIFKSINDHPNKNYFVDIAYIEKCIRQQETYSIEKEYELITSFEKNIKKANLLGKEALLEQYNNGIQEHYNEKAKELLEKCNKKMLKSPNNKE